MNLISIVLSHEETAVYDCCLYIHGTELLLYCRLLLLAKDFVFVL